MFNEAERRWAETMERIARQQHSADLLAIAAEALMIPEAWNLKQVLQCLKLLSSLDASPACWFVVNRTKVTDQCPFLGVLQLSP